MLFLIAAVLAIAAVVKLLCGHLFPGGVALGGAVAGAGLSLVMLEP